MNEPRFVVTTVTGWAITESHQRGGGNLKPPTIAYVLDSAYCFRVVGKFTSHGGNAWRKQSALAKAERKAAELNAWDAEQ